MIWLEQSKSTERKGDRECLCRHNEAKGKREKIEQM